MKKLFAILMASLLMFAVGCSQSSDSGNTGDDTSEEKTEKNNEENSEKADQGKSEEETKAAAASALMTFELEIVPKLHEVAAPFNSIAALSELSKEDFDPAELKSLVGEANSSATDFTSWVGGLSVPEELSDESKAKIESALQDLAANFEKRAEEINKLADAKSPEEVAKKWEAFTKAVQPGIQSVDTAFNDVHEKLGLGESSLAAELH